MSELALIDLQPDDVDTTTDENENSELQDESSLDVDVQTAVEVIFRV